MVVRRMRDPNARISDLAPRLSPQARVLYDLLESATADQVPALLRRLPPALLERTRALSPARRSFAPLRGDFWGFVSRDLPEGLRLAWWWYGLLGERS
jgi:hypothetical protein